MIIFFVCYVFTNEHIKKNNSLQFTSIIIILSNLITFTEFNYNKESINKANSLLMNKDFIINRNDKALLLLFLFGLCNYPIIYEDYFYRISI